MKRTTLVGIGAVTFCAAAAMLSYSATSQASSSRPLHPAYARQPALPSHASSITPSSGEDSFVPLTACRIVDTLSGGGAVASGATRTVHAAGTTGFSAQGGKRGGCGVPAGATAVSVSITTFRATHAGYVTAYQAGTTRPHSITASYVRGLRLTASSTVKLGGGQLRFYNDGGTVQVIIDVNGYMAAPIHATISPTGDLYAATSRVLSVTHNSTGSYTVLTDRDLTGCSVAATIRGGTYYASAFASGDSVDTTTWALSSTGSAVATDLYWDLIVTC